MSNFCNSDHEFWKNHLLQEVNQTLNSGLDTQFLRFFHECDLYGYLVFDRKTSKQLENKNITLLRKHKEELFFVQILRNMQLEQKHLVSGWSFCREILHEALILTCYQFWYPKFFHIFEPFHQCWFKFLMLCS